MKTSMRQNTQPKLNSLQNFQPVEFTEEWSCVAENTSRAAAFNTECSHSISDPDTPANAEQQTSSFVTSAWISVSNAS